MTKTLITRSPAETLASAEARAKRIRYIREQLLNMSRSELCKDSNLVEASLKSWELAMAGGLTEKGAEKFCRLVKSFNVYCSPAWLLYEIGEGPIKNPEKIPPSNDEDKQIANELLEFRKQPNAIDTVVKDDAMIPLLRPGDYVAGIMVKKIEKAINKECIIMTVNHNIFVRLLKLGDKTGKYLLACLNPNPVIAQPEIQNVEIQWAAPILWIRRRNR